MKEDKERGSLLFGQPPYGIASVALFFIALLILFLLSVLSPYLRELSTGIQKGIGVVLLSPPACLGIVLGVLALRESNGKTVWGILGLLLNATLIMLLSCMIPFAG